MIIDYLIGGSNPFGPASAWTEWPLIPVNHTIAQYRSLPTCYNRLDLPRMIE